MLGAAGGGGAGLEEQGDGDGTGVEDPSGEFADVACPAPVGDQVSGGQSALTSGAGNAFERIDELGVADSGVAERGGGRCEGVDHGVVADLCAAEFLDRFESCGNTVGEFLQSCFVFSSAGDMAEPHTEQGPTGAASGKETLGGGGEHVPIGGVFRSGKSSVDAAQC